MKKLKIRKPALIKFKTFPEFNGTLVPFYTNSFYPKKFVLKRFFTLYGKKKHFRADHAHKKCNQILIPVAGKIEVFILNQKKIKKKFILSLENNKYLFVPKKHWIRLKFLKEDSILLTLCDHKYDKKEYIQSIKKFLKNEM